MKKLTLLAAAFIAISFASCKKDYTCECTTTGNGSTSTASGATGKMKKSDAESKCNEGDASYTSGPYTYKTECSIK